MRALKKIFYGIIAVIMLLCAGIMVLAFSPDMTRSLSETLYGENGLLSGIGRKTTDLDSTGEMQLPAESQNLYQIADGVLASDSVLSYVAPVRGAMNLPEGVEQKNGYRPVTGSGEELGEDQIEALQGQLDTKETGDGLEFDRLYYPFYHMLNDKMQHLYRQIYANALKGNDSFAPVEQVNTAQLKNVFEAVYNDHPELFWLDTGYRCKYRAGGDCVEITLSYNRSAQNLTQSRQEFDSAAETILREARGKNSTLEKEEYVHDALAKRASYSLSAAMNQSAYSALVSGDTVCAGYSRAFQYLMMQLQVPCYYCTGYSGEDHAWNIIQVDGAYYNVDVTWDDTEPVSRDFFNKSDAEFVGTHVRTGLSVYLPPCGNSQMPVSGEEGSRQGGYSDGQTVAGIRLNPNPQQPLTWEPKPDTRDGRDSGTFVSAGDVYDMNKAGVSADGIQPSLKKYYANCLQQMVARGSGQQSFSNVVPKYVLKEVERSYGTGAYQKGYVEEGLKKLKMENFAIQIQVTDLGGNYYRLYHNIYTW